MMLRAEIAARLIREHEGRTRFHPLDPCEGVIDYDDAYALQATYVQMMRRRAGEKVGYKIGLTSERMQKMCGISSPVAGVVLANRVHRSGSTISIGNYARLGVEFEIGVRVAGDVIAVGQPYNAETITSAVSAVCAAVEIVDDRHADYATLDALSLIADNSWNAGVILGEWQPDYPPLSNIKGVVTLDGEEIDSGHGRDVLGHPFVPLAWLANHLIQQGTCLQAGDIVLTGSIVVTKFPTNSGKYQYDLTGIGQVEFAVNA
jgi:2-keto-4-pentenoate hydratase